VALVVVVVVVAATGEAVVVVGAARHNKTRERERVSGMAYRGLCVVPAVLAVS